ncbi:hypothetical protein [Bacillus sp. FJAT-27225]|uniref:hypothetical protein n=1 Tax=Bacillus sp. FJAT-27225 TaxID=1743144 RepID=UPI0011128779|nr:hypothetical protein [Bacillus sp. FJAT-27225]
MVAYAIYDDSTVYLFNHPKFKSDLEQPYATVKRDNQFAACTLILYENYPTAIVDMNLVKDYESLYATLVHELFHGYQYLKGESRFPNEVMGITYPLLVENIQLRNLERTNLFSAFNANNSDVRDQYIQAFIAIREKRESIISEYLIYESLIETVEGPAWYIEYKAYNQKSSLPYNSVLNKFAPILTDNLESSLHLRKSCYGSGLFMCLLLDKIVPDWKRSFFDSKNSLFDFLKQQVGDFQKALIGDVPITKKSEEIFDVVMESTRKPFEQFNMEPGIHLHIEGTITIKSFDPMNTISLDEKRLYKTFLRVRINEKDYLIKQPVVAYFNKENKSVEKIHLILKEPPIESNYYITIEEIGVIEGKYLKKGNYLSITVK